ncbi:MAG: hypothetical protein GXY58_05775 [Planctomycetaceae bacterium]|nr:hypothetical protein [Planctomycetaceae bacterium]
MMLRHPNIAAVICGVVTTGCLKYAVAQTHERMQPIVLTASPAHCQSPAHIAQPPLVRQTTVGASYMSPTVAESLPAAISASELVPLPAGSPWRSCATQAPAPVVQYSVPAPVVTPGPRVEALRPVTDDPEVPDGYVVGRSLMGQPKLFKPGQPVRNLIRYLSL